jgi:hypothetical protein
MKVQAKIAWLPDDTGWTWHRDSTSSLCHDLLRRFPHDTLSQRQNLQPPAGRSG